MTKDKHLSYARDGSLASDPNRPTGFPSPAADYAQGPLDLNEIFIHDAPCTFFWRMEGDEMRGASIQPGDILLVQRLLPLSDGCLIVCYHEGEHLVRNYRRVEGRTELHPADDKYPVIVLGDGQQLMLQGVVKSIHRPLK